jgi:hypothetical protein
MIQDPLPRVVSNWNKCIREADDALTVEDIVDSEVRAEVGLFADDGLRCEVSNMHTYSLACRCRSCRTWDEYDAACPSTPSTFAQLKASHARPAALARVDAGSVMIGLASEWHASICTWLYLLDEPAFANCGCRTSPWVDAWSDPPPPPTNNSLTTALLRVTLGLGSDDLSLYADLSLRFTQLVQAVEAESGVQLLGCGGGEYM